MENEFRGPVMLAATSVLKQAPARVSRLGAGIKLPRTIPIRTLLMCLLTGSLFLGVTTLFLGLHPRSAMLSLVFGGGFGWFLVTYQPLEGETMFKWLGLTFGAFRDRKLKIDGKRAQAYVGICPIETISRGQIVIAHGHADVSPDSVDERGGRIPSHLREGGVLERLGRREEGER